MATLPQTFREEGWELVEQHLKQGVVTLDHARKEVLNSIWKHCWIRRIVDRDLAAMLRNAFEKLVDAGVLLIEDELERLSRQWIQRPSSKAVFCNRPPVCKLIGVISLEVYKLNYIDPLSLF